MYYLEKFKSEASWSIGHQFEILRNPWGLSARVIENGYYGTYCWTIPRITIPRIVLTTAWPAVCQNQVNAVQIDDVATKMRIGSAIGTLVILS